MVKISIPHKTGVVNKKHLSKAGSRGGGQSTNLQYSNKFYSQQGVWELI